MNVKFTFRHMDASDALESYAEIKLLQALGKYRSAIAMDVDACFTIEGDKQMTCVMQLAASDGLEATVRESGSYMYDCVDRACGKLEILMRKHKERELQRRQVAVGIDAAEPMESASQLRARLVR